MALERPAILGSGRGGATPNARSPRSLSGGSSALAARPALWYRRAMKLYGNLNAPTTRMIQVTLAEKQHQADFVPIDFAKRDQKWADQPVKHPFGVTPMLEDDGFLIYEARAILRYLDKRLGGPRLTPEDTRAFGRMEQFIGVEMSYLSPNAMTLVYARMRPTEPAALDLAKEKLKAPLDVANEALGQGEFLAGETFTLADIVWMPYVNYLLERGAAELVTSRPNVDAWWKRISARPSWTGLAKA
jgi:glutathione S-transferase